MNFSRRVFDDVSQLIGSRENPTPLVRLRKLPGPDGGAIYAKLEWMNPFGSIKDRTARAVLAGVRRRRRGAGGGAISARLEWRTPFGSTRAGPAGSLLVG